MSDVSTYEWRGVRFGTLGSDTDLVVAAPLAENDSSVEAHTGVARIGYYFDRTVAAEKMGFVIMGTDVLGITETSVQILGFDAWHVGTLPDPQDKSEKGTPSGYAPLDALSKVPNVYLPSSLVGGLIYLGVWDANTNTPVLASGAGSLGRYYVVNVAGATNLDGTSTWSVGDIAIFNGAIWQRIPDGDRAVVRAAALDPTAGYLDTKVDNVTIQVNGSYELEVISPGGVVPANTVTVDTSGFSIILSPADSDVQLALDTLDVHTHELDALSDVTLVTGVTLTNAVPVTVDSTVTGTGWKWLVNIIGPTGNHVLVEVLAALLQDPIEDVDYTIYPGTSSFPHSIEVLRAAGTTSLRITASGVGYTAAARRFYMP